MDNVPFYLLRFFMRIRGHEREKGWLHSELSKMPFEDAFRARLDISALVELKLIDVSKSKSEIVSDNRWVDMPGGGRAFTGGSVERLYVPDMFIVLSRGRHLVSEYLQKALLWFLAAILGAVVGSLATMHLSDALQGEQANRVERVVRLDATGALENGVRAITDELNDLGSMARAEVGKVDEAIKDVP